ncbi:MAG: S46 family peptidase [Alistipes sp.]|nr:S46 family peptidase [Alistipes sp.]
MKLRTTVLCLVLALGVQPSAADEGMWMIQQLAGIYPQMKARGVKLPVKAIYNDHTPALSDAVVAIDGGVGTGSMISHEGLLITNHHVAYSDICDLSTPEHNYLETGFWARTKADELPVKGKTVSFLRRVEDVTDEANALRDEMQAAGRWGIMSMRKLYADIEKRHAAETPYEVSCVGMWGGRKFYLYYYEVYRDVRLVGAPPVSIGSFGGDIDNWSWPQHKGDFALYRVYADEKGKPADYSPENVPLNPAQVLTVSTQGVHDDDYTMIIGFPGRTSRYTSSYGIAERQEVKNPIVVADRHRRMEIIKRRMERDPAVRMKYSDAYFSLSNFADLAKWENVCLRRFGIAAKRRAEERELAAWIIADPERTAAYGDLLPSLERGYAARRQAERHLNHFRESWLGPSEAILVGNRLSSYLARLDRLGIDTLDIRSKDAAGVRSNSARLRRNYDAATDRELMARMVVCFTDSVPRSHWGEGLCRMYDEAGGDALRMAYDAFDHSFCTDADRFDAYFAQNRAVSEIRRDPLVRLTESVRIDRFTKGVDRAEKRAGHDVGKLESRYHQALYAFREAQGRPQYPNANSTMRLTYGRVRALTPSDGVHCDARTTAAGYTEKYDPSRYEFRVDDRMRRLIEAEEWGRWGEKAGKTKKGARNGSHEARSILPVNFLTDNDITGGNSGSPVLDARGRLIGLAFDGNRESMACDIWFQPDYARTVCVDIRFVMWVIERYAGAGHLLDEIAFTE